MPRPKSHYRTGKYSHLIKAKNARAFHGVKPDIDNLVKFYMDLMNKVFYVDDSQICALATIKVYSYDDTDPPRTEVTIKEI